MALVTFTTRSNLVAGNNENIADVADCLDKLLAGVNSVDDTQLVSPNNSVQRPVFGPIAFRIDSTLASGTKYIGFDTADAIASGVSTVGGVPTFYWPDAASVAVAGKTATIRLRTTIAVNAVAPAATITYGLYPVSAIAGTGTSTTFTLGTVVSGTTCAFASPAAGSSSTSGSSGVSVPSLSGGLYLVGVTVSASLAANSTVYATCTIEQAHS